MRKKLFLTLTITLLASLAAADMEFRSSSPIDVYSQFNMHSNPIVNLEDPDADGDAKDSDALNLGYANSLYLQRTGDTFEGNLDMDGYRIQNLPTPAADSDAATRGYVDSQIGSTSGSQNISQVLDEGNLANQSINMGDNDITNLATPDADSDAVNRGYVMDNYLNRNSDSMNGYIDMNGNAIRNAGTIESPLISGQLDLNSSKIVNVSQPENPGDVVTLEYFNSQDSEGSDNQTLSVEKVNGEDTNITIDNGNTVTVNDYFEADTNAETRCSSGQVLTGSGCTSQYNSSDDGDSSLGNEGVNSISFDTSTGDLTLGREHRTSLTQNLDGRYPTSDTNTQLDDQAAQSNVDMNGNDLDNVGGLNGDCPSGYVWVPGSSKYGTDPGFCVMKWEAKDDGSGNPVSQASGSPWVNIDQYDARKECRSLGSDYHLITESEWMTIAENAMRQSSNWADGNIGSKASDGGGMYIGNVDPGSSHSHLGYDGADPESGTGRDTTARLQLSNGNYIWDFSGNVWEWTNGYVTTDGVPEPDANGWTEYTAITKFQEMSDEKPLNPSWNASNGIGRIYLDQSPYSNNDKITDNIHAVRRGGHWGLGASAGALSVTLHGAPSHTYSGFGFRCVADL